MDLLKGKSNKELLKWKEQLFDNTSKVVNVIMSLTTHEELYTQTQAAKKTGKHRHTIVKYMTVWKEEGRLKNGKIPKSLLDTL